SPLATLLAQREQPPPSLRAARSDCPPALDALFRRMIARRPQDRPSSMNAVVAELERVQRDGGLPLVTRRGLLAFAGLGVAALVGLHAWPFFTPPSGSPSDPPPKTPTDPLKGATPHIDMVRIEAGKFEMGSGESERDAL